MFGPPKVAPVEKPATPAPVPRTPVKRDATPSGTVRKTVTRNDKIVEEKQADTDEFRDLIKEDGSATISCSLTKGVDFNSEKITFFVSARCDQNTKTMDRAAEQVLMKALDYVNSAGDLLGWKKQ